VGAGLASLTDSNTQNILDSLYGNPNAHVVAGVVALTPAAVMVGTAAFGGTAANAAVDTTIQVAKVTTTVAGNIVKVVSDYTAAGAAAGDVAVNTTLVAPAVDVVGANGAGSVSGVITQASDEAATLIASGSKNPAVSVAGNPALGIQTQAYSNIIAKVPTFPGVQMSADSSTFVITDQSAFMNGVNQAYASSGQTLNSLTAEQIQNYISSQTSFPVQAGVPGLHAEVQSLNSLYNTVPNPSSIYPSDINIATIKLGPSNAASQQGGAFPACTNCSGIIPPQTNVITGRK
jgi:filamentous hemagglutinin